MEQPWIAGFVTRGPARLLWGFLLSLVCLRIGLDLANPYYGTGKPFFTDFTSFWTAARAVLDGDPTLPYTMDAFFWAQVDHFGRGMAAFFYPPTWLMLVTPFGLAPYEVSSIVFEALTLVACIFALSKLARSRNVGLAMLIFPGLLFCIVHGQNSMLNVALFAGCLACLDQERLERGRLVWAGVLIGLMSYKPHMGILVPFAFLAARLWLPFLSAAVTAVLMALGSLLLLGSDAWLGFLSQASVAQEWMTHQWIPLSKFASLFALLLNLGIAFDLAVVAQGVLSCLVLAAVIAVWWHKGLPLAVKGAVLVSSVTLFTPFILDYDLAFLAIPMVLIYRLGREYGFLRFELELCLLASCLMIYSGGWGLGLDFVPIVGSSLIFFLSSLRRAHVHWKEGQALPA